MGAAEHGVSTGVRGGMYRDGVVPAVPPPPREGVAGTRRRRRFTSGPWVVFVLAVRLNLFLLIFYSISAAKDAFRPPNI